ncbi:MAG: peptidoglycan-binding protein [Proteobacteria bacterium]|nr:MAG: peptidoglycan-binding protein [Pseudomonadota bacterium]
MKYSQLIVSVLLLSACKANPETTQKKSAKSGNATPVLQEAKDEDNESDDKDTNPIVDERGNPIISGEINSDTVQSPIPQVEPLAGIKIPAFCAKIKDPGDWKSAYAFYNSAGRLSYPQDKEGNRIPDFSYAGYHYGNEEPPVYPVVATLSAVTGDNTKSIQDAINAIGKKAPDAKGIRGALLLKPGRYTVLGTIIIAQNGIVLRGSGAGNDPSRDSIIIADKDLPHQRTVIVIGTGKDNNWKTTGAAVEITDSFVPVGAKEFNVKDASSFKKLDLIEIKHPSTQAWLNAVNGGGTISDPKWTVGSTDIVFQRRITAIEGKTIKIDAPLYNHLDLKLATSVVTKLSDSGVVSESGVEDLRVDIVTAGGEDENHAWDAVGVWGAQDSWVKNITALHFGQSGVYTREAMRITVDGTTAIEPVGIRTGERFYNYNSEKLSQLILFKNCVAKDGRHNFISNGVQTSSGLVWYKCSSDGDSASEGHRRWTQGMLFDSITEKGGGSINIYNREDFGTSHGWGSAHSVIWNYNGTALAQKPPTAQNYIVSSSAKRKTKAGAPEGATEIKAGRLGPLSLYEAQLCERLQK